MKFLIVLVAVVAVAYSQEGGYGGHQGQQQGYGHGHATSYIEQNLHNKEEKEVHIKAHPKFHYDYKVADPKHHDFKEKHEAREGYHVKGSYSFLQPDHLVRVVDYESDKKNGWNAKVTYRKHQ